MKKLGFVFLCVAALAGNSFGYWFQAYGSGDWGTIYWGHEAGTTATVPGVADDVYIDIGQVVSLNVTSSVKSLTLGRSNGAGTLNVNTAGKTLTVSGTTTIGFSTTIAGTLNVTAGAVMLNGPITLNAKGVVSITNNAATAVSVPSFATCDGTFKFTLGATGVTPITVVGSAVNLSQSKFVVDVSAYTGGLATIPLLSAPSLTAVSPSVTLTGTKAGWSAAVTQAAGVVAVRMVPPPSLDLILYTK